MASKSLWLAAALTAAASGPALAEVRVRMMTGPASGEWAAIAATLKATWEKQVEGLVVEPIAGAAISNIRAVDEGKVEIAFGNSIVTVDAVAGRAPFKAPYKNICNVATLYPEFFQLVVRGDSGIGQVADIRGKRLMTTGRGTTAEMVTRHALRAAGLGYGDVTLRLDSFEAALSGMTGDGVQVFAVSSMIPNLPVRDVAERGDARLLDLSAIHDDMRRINPGYRLATIPAGTYPRQDKPVRVIGYAAHIVTHCSVPGPLIYTLVKTLSAQLGAVGAQHAEMKGMTPALLAGDIGVPVHAGARRYYFEAGLLKP